MLLTTPLFILPSIPLLPIFLFAVFSVTSVSYMLLIRKLPFKGDFILKSVPILCLALITFLFVPAIFIGVPLFLGFIFSAGGDISLSFDKKKGMSEKIAERNFLIGLGLFLIAHVLFTFAFAQNFVFSVERLPWLGLLLVLVITMLVALFPKLGNMKIPVILYITVIFTMVVSALFWQGDDEAFALLLTGAILFMLSDAMISIDMFIKPISWSKYFIMSTYYIGQLLILLAFV